MNLGGMRDTSGPDLVGSERDVLLYCLNKMRDAVVRTSEGPTDQQQRIPGVPSGTNLLGLIQHLTGVEVHWFRDDRPGAAVGSRLARSVGSVDAAPPPHALRPLTE